MICDFEFGICKYMDFSLIIPAFIAGVLTFLAPCTLPLVPGFLGFISGVSLSDLKDEEKQKKARLKIFLTGLFFMVGFSIVFITLGTLVGFIGATVLAPYRLWLGRIGGIFVIIFGLFMMNVIKIPILAQEKRWNMPTIFERGNPANSLILGSAFAFGWTPCVGPILGAILTLAAVSTTALDGAILLAVFSLGLAIPFLAIALGISSAAQYLNKISKYLNAVSVAGGAFLIFLGILLVTDSMGAWISFFFRTFDFINYERLLKYL